MAVKIRLARVGAKGHPCYRVVVADERAARVGKVIEIIGTYNAQIEPSKFEVNKEKTLAWLKKGAIPTDTVRKMLGKIGVMKPVDFTNFKKRAPKSHGEGAKEEKTAETAPAQK